MDDMEMVYLSFVLFCFVFFPYQSLRLLSCPFLSLHVLSCTRSDSISFLLRFWLSALPLGLSNRWADRVSLCMLDKNNMIKVSNHLHY